VDREMRREAQGRKNDLYPLLHAASCVARTVPTREKWGIGGKIVPELGLYALPFLEQVGRRPRE